MFPITTLKYVFALDDRAMGGHELASSLGLCGAQVLVVAIIPPLCGPGVQALSKLLLLPA